MGLNERNGTLDLESWALKLLKRKSWPDWLEREWLPFGNIVEREILLEIVEREIWWKIVERETLGEILKREVGGERELRLEFILAVVVVIEVEIVVVKTEIVDEQGGRKLALNLSQVSSLSGKSNFICSWTEQIS